MSHTFCEPQLILLKCFDGLNGALAHKNNLAVYPWTFRRDTFNGDFEQFINFSYQIVEVDGFITSQPDVVLKLLEKQKSSSNHITIFIWLYLSCLLIFMYSIACM